LRQPSLGRVRELLRLDVETGLIYRRINSGSRGKADALAGSFHKASGYIIIGIDGVKYRAHLLVWLMLYGEWRPREIDHKDQSRSNNRPDNLRIATESQQRQNMSLRCDNTSGHRGVGFQAGKHTAELWVEGRKIWLGRYTTKEEAAEVARAARLKHFGEYAPAYDRQEG